MHLFKFAQESVIYINLNTHIKKIGVEILYFDQNKSDLN